jgi:hypothetical protein
MEDSEWWRGKGQHEVRGDEHRKADELETGLPCADGDASCWCAAAANQALITIIALPHTLP